MLNTYKMKSSNTMSITWTLARELNLPSLPCVMEALESIILSFLNASGIYYDIMDM